MRVEHFENLSFLFLVSPFLSSFITVGTYGLPTTPKTPGEDDDFCLHNAEPGPDDELEGHNITILMNCVKKVGLSETNIIVYDETLEKKDYDDKCLARCVYTEHKLLNEEGEPLREAFVNELESHFKGKKQEALLNITNSCITATSSKVDTQGGPKAIPCKFAAMLAYCFVREVDKFCGKSGKMQ